MINRTPARDRPGALGWRRGSQYRGSRVMPVEGRGLSSRQTQQAVRDREIGQPNNSETCSEAADGVTRKSEGRSWLSLLCLVRQDALTTSCVCLELRPLPSPGITRPHRYCEPLRPPSTPRPSLTGVWLIIPDHALGFPVLRALSLCTCCRHYPGAAEGRMLRSCHPTVSAFPGRVAGSACTSSFSRLARRSLALRPAHSRGHQFVPRYARRAIIAVVGARLDTKLNLHLFSRLLRLPLDYFERHPAGETMYQVAQVYRVREFLTGQLLATFLDLLTLAVLLPFLFWLNAPLAWVVLLCAGLISIIILAYLKPMREMYSRVVGAETWKAAALSETIIGIKTVKALALEPQRRAQWDERVAETGKWRLALARLSNWPQTLVTPLERFMTMGTLMLGAYWAMDDNSGYMVGGLFAFMMLSGRVAQPLVGLARLVQEYEEVSAAIGEAGAVVDRPLEIDADSGGLRPKFAGAISFQDVTFTYGGTKIPALSGVSFSIPAGTMLGIVGKSGSGQATIARLVPGVNAG